MDTKDTFTCIIPFYNEEERVLSVVQAIKKVRCVSQIICVDDGSTDNAANLLKEKFPQITLIKLRRNLGKAQAVFSGLRLVKNENLLLIDADLINLKSEEIGIACKRFAKGSVDMIIFKVKGSNWLIDEVLRKYIFQRGNRILKKKDLREVERMNPSGYQLEVATNRYMIERHKKVCWIDCTAFNPHKMRKLSFFEGLQRDLKMDKEIISYLGLVAYLKQMLLFARKKCLWTS